MPSSKVASNASIFTKLRPAQRQYVMILCNRCRRYITPFFQPQKKIALSIEVIIGPLLFTKIIGFYCERHTKSINRIYSKKSASNIEAREAYCTVIIVVYVIFILIVKLRQTLLSINVYGASSPEYRSILIAVGTSDFTRGGARVSLLIITDGQRGTDLRYGQILCCSPRS